MKLYGLTKKINGIIGNDYNYYYDNIATGCNYDINMAKGGERGGIVYLFKTLV
jgi:hypothetical protein